MTWNYTPTSLLHLNSPVISLFSPLTCFDFTLQWELSIGGGATLDADEETTLVREVEKEAIYGGVGIVLGTHMVGFITIVIITQEGTNGTVQMNKRLGTAPKLAQKCAVSWRNSSGTSKESTSTKSLKSKTRPSRTFPS